MDILKKYIPFLIFLVTFSLMAKAVLLHSYPDFQAYYFGAKTALGGGNPYVNIENKAMPFLYPPTALFLFMPLTILPVFIAEKAWVVLSVIALVLSLYLICRLYNKQFFSFESLLLSSLVFLSFPVKFTLGMGQVNHIILLFVTVSFYFYKKHKDTFSGVFLGLPIMVKLFPVLLLFYYLLKKRWKAVMASIGFIVVLGVAGFILSPKVTLYYIHNILPGLLSAWPADYYNQALSGFLVREVQDQSTRNNIKLILSALMLFSMLFVLVKRTQKKKMISDLTVSLVIVTSLLINSFSWQHHFVFLILPFFIIYYYLTTRTKYTRYLILLGISYLLIAGNLQYPNLMPHIIQSHVFLGGLLLWLININLLWKAYD